MENFVPLTFGGYPSVRTYSNPRAALYARRYATPSFNQRIAAEVQRNHNSIIRIQTAMRRLSAKKKVARKRALVGPAVKKKRIKSILKNGY